MKRVEADVVIIGAGLTGLSLAYFLRNKNINVVLVEGRARLGGRILTLKKEGQAPLEMGATWVHDHHHACLDLLKELGVSVFEEAFGSTAIYEASASDQAQLVNLPPSGQATYRIAEGSSSLINRLASNIDSQKIYLNQEVLSIEESENSVIVKSQEYSLKGSMVVSTLPPFLFANTIKVTPALPDELLAVCRNTRTWMGDSIKVALTYDDCFWKEGERLGTIFSRVGPIFEMYDHSDIDECTFALKGFINGVYKDHTKSARCQLVVSQLEKFYGARARAFITYEDVVWGNEKFTSTPMEELLEPRRNFGHPVFQKSYMNGRLMLAGTETSRGEGGFMEGAILSAKLLATKIQHEL